jgi:hypothetical protein
MSFDDKLVEITTQPLSEGGTLPATGGFSSADDQNIASITFDEDGTYGYVINCTDLAGNKQRITFRCIYYCIRPYL